MLKAIKFTVLVVLLILSSCKKQVFKTVSCDNLKNGLSHQNYTEEDSAGGRTKVFSPVSYDKAKQLVRDLDIIVQEPVIIDSGFAVEDKAPVKIEEPVSSVDKDIEYKNSIEDAELVRQKEAKLSDIPVPINSEPLVDYFKFKTSKNEIIFGYNSFMDASSVANFYNQEMEFFGWENVLFFDGIEKMMLFKKPSRFCSISIRGVKGKVARSKKSSRDYKCEIVVFVQN